MTLGVAVLSGFALAGLAPWLCRVFGRWSSWALASLPAALFAYFVSLLPTLATGATVRESVAWVPSVGIHFSFHVDGLSLLMALLITGIGTLIFVYAGGYLAGHQYLGRFFAILLLFMASMLGVVLSDNLLAIFIFWELTSLTSYLLVGFNHERPEARAAAMQALLVTSGGGLALMAGFVLMGLAGGSFEISELLSRPDLLRGHDLYLPMTLLVLAGAFTKSAQFPFHFWLPGAMVAPTPVSAYLHSATMVKAGVYLLARMQPLLGGTELWVVTVTSVGVTTMLVGGVLALFHTDLKRVLAYSTISALGTLVLLLGLGTVYAATAATVYLLAHALYKGSLFMVAGAIDHETGTRDIEQVGGLRRLMPVTAGVAVLAAISLAGVGPVLSFIGKELLLEAVLESTELAYLLVPATVVSGGIFVAVAGIVAIRPFFGTAVQTPKKAHEAPPSMWSGPLVLALMGLIIGLYPTFIAESLVAPTVASILGHPEPVHLYLWHGPNLALALSGLSLLTGAGLYVSWRVLRRGSPLIALVSRIGPAQWYMAALTGLNAVAAAQTRLLQNGYLRFYLMVVSVTAVGLIGWSMVRWSGPNIPVVWSEIRPYEVILVGVILVAAIVAINSMSRLFTIVSLGVVGYGVALIFLLYGAPDLAMTQILIETLTVILFVLVLQYLPRFATHSSKSTRARDAIVAIAIGLLMGGQVLVATTTQFEAVVSNYFAEYSYTEAHGRNIVNVILVDFRALDTLGEITVLALAALGVYGLLKIRPRSSGKGGE